MFLTLDTLKRLGACGQGVKYFERFYPNGVEVIDIIGDRHINKEFLHWGRKHLDLTPEELQAYDKACRIENTEGYWYSLDVKNSKYIIKSKNIEGCIGVFSSSDVSNSRDISASDSVSDSSQIFYSSFIEESEKILKGQNIINSVNICNSTMVARSRNIIDSSNVFDSSEIVNCDTVSNSHFCQKCTDIKNCMFCEGLIDAEYYIFNKPVDKNYYELFEKQYKKYLTVLLDFVQDWPEEMMIEQFISPTRKFDDWYHPISDKFWKWARTLPNFDSMLLYNITMFPENLID